MTSDRKPVTRYLSLITGEREPMTHEQWSVVATRVSARASLVAYHEHGTATVANQVLCHPANARVQCAIEAVTPDDDKVEAVIVGILAERGSGIVRLDRLVPHAKAERQGCLLRARLHLLQDLATPLGHLLLDLVSRLCMRVPLQHRKNDDLGSDLVGEVRRGAKRMLGVSRAVPPNDHAAEARHDDTSLEPSACAADVTR
jgi:hypothetical protein